LLKSTDKKGFHTIRTTPEFHEAAENAAKACPVKIISVKII
jgi:ferredoxin